MLKTVTTSRSLRRFPEKRASRTEPLVRLAAAFVLPMRCDVGARFVQMHMLINGRSRTPE